MKTATIYALNAGKTLAKAGCELVHFKSNMSNAKIEARRAFKRTFRSAEDFFDDVAVSIKRKPLKSVGFAFGLAFGVGVFTGWLGARR